MEVITYMDYMTIIFSFITMIFEIINYFKNKRQYDRIKIYFVVKSTNKMILIDKNILRKDCQRSEIQGVLRTKLIKGKSYYEIDYLKNDKYYQSIYNIQITKSNILKIYLEDDELTQFGIQK